MPIASPIVVPVCAIVLRTTKLMSPAPPLLLILRESEKADRTRKNCVGRGLLSELLSETSISRPFRTGAARRSQERLRHCVSRSLYHRGVDALTVAGNRVSNADPPHIAP